MILLNQEMRVLLSLESVTVSQTSSKCYLLLSQEVHSSVGRVNTRIQIQAKLIGVFFNLTAFGSVTGSNGSKPLYKAVLMTHFYFILYVYRYRQCHAY